MSPQEWLTTVDQSQWGLRILITLNAKRLLEEFNKALKSKDHKALYVVLQTVWIRVPINPKLRKALPGWQELDKLCVRYGGKEWTL